MLLVRRSAFDLQRANVDFSTFPEELEVWKRWCHLLSRRSDRDVIIINCTENSTGEEKIWVNSWPSRYKKDIMEYYKIWSDGRVVKSFFPNVMNKDAAMDRKPLAIL